MSNVSVLPLQQTIYTTLTNDIPLMAMVTGVYDHVPQHTAYPYVYIAASAISDVSNMETNLMRQRVRLHVCSREGGRKEVAAIMERLHGLLHLAALNPVGQTLHLLHFSGSRIMLDDDGWTYRGEIEFTALVEIT